jgi:hypothetical protein
MAQKLFIAAVYRLYLRAAMGRQEFPKHSAIARATETIPDRAARRGNRSRFVMNLNFWI